MAHFAKVINGIVQQIIVAEPENIDSFVENEFLALDAKAFRVYRESIEPDIILKYDYVSQTGGNHIIDIPLGIDFFWPAAIQ